MTLTRAYVSLADNHAQGAGARVASEDACEEVRVGHHVSALKGVRPSSAPRPAAWPRRRLRARMTALPSALRHWAFQERFAWGSSAAVMSALLYIFYGERFAPAPAPRRVSLLAATAHDADAVAVAATAAATAAAAPAPPEARALR